MDDCGWWGNCGNMWKMLQSYKCDKCDVFSLYE